MKDEFLSNLRYTLRALNLNEASKYIQQYEEIFEEKKERGYDDVQIIREFGDIREIAKNILETYDNNQESMKYFNKYYIAGDAFIMVISSVLSMLICFSMGFMRMTKEYFGVYIGVITGSIVILLISNYLLGVYRVKSQNNLGRAVGKSVLAGLLSNLVIFLLLFFIRLIYVSRLFIFIFILLTVFFEVLNYILIFQKLRTINNTQLRKID